MAEFNEVMKQRKRMCKAYFNGGCEKCPLSGPQNSTGQYCNNYMLDHYEGAEEIIMEWAKGHPIKTNRDKFEEVFGFNHSVYCPHKNCSCMSNCSQNCAYYGFWDKEYVKPKGDFYEI